MPQLNCVILAAGKGKRMVSKRPKILHPIMGKPMVHYVVDAARGLGVEKVIVVIGHEREIVEEYLKNEGVEVAVQSEQKGTAHALLSTEALLESGEVLVLYGDVPLIRPETLQAFTRYFLKSDGIAFMTTRVERPDGYGRVILDGDAILDIVEDSEAAGAVREINVINTGICMIRTSLLDLVKAVTPDNTKGEYYLTDICKIAKKRGLKVGSYLHPDASEVLGINSRKELLEANLLMRNAILDRHMENGVTIADRSVYIESDVRIGKDTFISPYCYLTGETEIGEDVLVGPHVMIKDSHIGRGSRIEAFTSLDGVTTEEAVTIGPFSRIRPTTHLKKKAKVGNFVEVKNSVIGPDTKASHLSYIGDAEVGQGVNIGAGTITCNYDGKRKHRTTIGDGVFVGSNTELVAPVTLGNDAVIGAGSTITHDVPEGALAVTRAKQKNIEGYARRKKCAE